MPKLIKKLNSNLVLGIEKFHEDHSGTAHMHSTGVLGQIFEGEDDSTNWFLEYLCDTCQGKVFAWHADVNDIIRAALKEKGIIKE